MCSVGDTPTYWTGHRHFHNNVALYQESIFVELAVWCLVGQSPEISPVSEQRHLRLSTMHTFTNAAESNLDPLLKRAPLCVI